MSPRRSGAARAASCMSAPPVGRVERNLRIIEGRARDRSFRDLADELSMSASGVRCVALRHEHEITLRRLQIERAILETFDEAVEAQLAIASDPKHPRCTDAFGNLSEIAFPSHGGAVVNVAGRDVVEPGAATMSDEERARLEEILALPMSEVERRLAEMEGRSPSPPAD